MDAMHREQASALTKASIFNKLTSSTLGRLAAGTTELAVKRGSVVFGRGTNATGIYVVVSGQLKLTLETPQGAGHVVELVQEGDSFGEAALLANRPHLLTATAVTDCALLHIGRQTLMTELERDLAFARQIIGTLSERLYGKTSELENVLFLKATGRVARFILDRVHSDGGKSGLRVALPVSKGLIASHLNMTQEHFSRTLRELTLSGLIRVEGIMVDVIDVDRLRKTAGLMPAPRYLQAAE